MIIYVQNYIQLVDIWPNLRLWPSWQLHLWLKTRPEDGASITKVKYIYMSTSELHLLEPDPNRISHSHLCISLSYHVLRPFSTCKPQQKLKCSPRLRMCLVVAKGMSQDHRNQRASPAENPQALHSFAAMPSACAQKMLPHPSCPDQQEVGIHPK